MGRIRSQLSYYHHRPSFLLHPIIYCQQIDAWGESGGVYRNLLGTCIGSSLHEMNAT